jgi:hypothetical protein
VLIVQFCRIAIAAMTGQPRTGFQEQNIQDKTHRTGQPEQESQNWTDAIGQTRKDIWARTVGTGNPGQDI